MKCLNFGSLSIDYVYSQDHIVIPGETITSYDRNIFAGGKGLNQSIALTKAGVPVFHAGQVGPDGDLLKAALIEAGADISLLKTVASESGHTIIQVDKKGQNAIIRHGGSNHTLTRDYIDEVFSNFGKGDIVLFQNELNDMPYLMQRAYETGMRIVLNPSPFDERIMECDLSMVAIFLLNEIEGFQISGEEDPDKILAWFQKTYPESMVVLTLGKRGALCGYRGEQYRHGIYQMPVVDTTAAGDTFTGYFIAAVLEEKGLDEALESASRASSIAVSRPGAAGSIPEKEEVAAYVFPD